MIRWHVALFMDFVPSESAWRLLKGSDEKELVLSFILLEVTLLV